MYKIPVKSQDTMDASLKARLMEEAVYMPYSRNAKEVS